MLETAVSPGPGGPLASFAVRDSALQPLDVMAMPPIRAAMTTRICLDILMFTFLSGSVARKGRCLPIRITHRPVGCALACADSPSQGNAEARQLSRLQLGSHCPNGSEDRDDFGREVRPD